MNYTLDRNTYFGNWVFEDDPRFEDMIQAQQTEKKTTKYIQLEQLWRLVQQVVKGNSQFIN